MWNFVFVDNAMKIVTMNIRWWIERILKKKKNVWNTFLHGQVYVCVSESIDRYSLSFSCACVCLVYTYISTDERQMHVWSVNFVAIKDRTVSSRWMPLTMNDKRSYTLQGCLLIWKKNVRSFQIWIKSTVIVSIYQT